MTNEEIKNAVSEISKLTAANKVITEAGGFFTPEQVANEKISWKLKMKLRFEAGMEIGTY